MLLLNHLQYAFAGLRTDITFIIQNAGNRGFSDATQARNVIYGQAILHSYFV
jgi:hypothetical protein